MKQALKQVKFQGLTIVIENDAGSVREGTSSDGKKWQTTMSYPYGYIKNTMGVDGDEIDCFIGPVKNAKWAYIVHQTSKDGRGWDEDKVMLGFEHAMDAVQAYRKGFDIPDHFYASTTTMSMKDFKTKIKTSKESPMMMHGAARRNPFKVGDSVAVDGMHGRGIVTHVDGDRCIIRFRSGEYLSRDFIYLHNLADRVKSMWTGLQAGGPGSGRRPGNKGLKPVKPFSDMTRKEQVKVRQDKNQMSIFGPGHTKELSRLKSGEEMVEREGTPITPPPGQKRIVKRGTLFCVESDGVDKNFGCWPSREQADAVASGKSFIEPMMKAAKWQHPSEHTPFGDVTHASYVDSRWSVDHETGAVYPPRHARVEKERKFHRKKVEKANKTFVGGVVASVGIGFAGPPVSKGAKIGHMLKEKKVHKGVPGVGHKLVNPSMHKGKGVNHRFTNPSMRAVKSYADYGEPMAGALQHAHLDTNLWFHPPSLKNADKIPTDDPKEKNNRFLDVTKRKEAKEQRMKLLKRSAPGGTPPQIPARTTLLSPHQAVYMPGMLSSAVGRRRRRAGGGMFRAFGAAQI